MNYKDFIGIDVSKKWLDFTVIRDNLRLFHVQKENSPQGISEFILLLKAEPGYKKDSSVFCMEHTGIYNNHLLDHLLKSSYKVSLQSGLEIRQSSGLQRGKNDKVDSLRIAQYAYKNRETLRLWNPGREVLSALKHLTTLRRRLINVAKQLKTPVKEAEGFLSKNNSKKLAMFCCDSIKALKADLKIVDKEILSIIKSDPELSRLFTIVTSVSGIGPATATEIMITTNEFKDIHCPKKFACYGGIAPFEHQSGSSIRGRTRVSSMGNKKVKTLLHMSALTAILYNPELKEYYKRKVNEGKNKMLVLNAVRNKLIHRIFSCVNENRIYEKNYLKSFA